MRHQTNIFFSKPVQQFGSEIVERRERSRKDALDHMGKNRKVDRLQHGSPRDETSISDTHGLRGEHDHARALRNTYGKFLECLNGGHSKKSRRPSRWTTCFRSPRRRYKSTASITAFETCQEARSCPSIEIPRTLRPAWPLVTHSRRRQTFQENYAAHQAPPPGYPKTEATNWEDAVIISDEEM